MVSFPTVFGKEARVVVILYRPKWGKTAYTAIEERAIQTRTLTEADFILLVKLDDGRPAWYSESGIYVDARKVPIDNVAGHIEAVVKRRGGHIVRETLEELNARQQRERRRTEEFNRFYNSKEGAAAGQSRYLEIMRVFDERTKVLEESSPGMFDAYHARPNSFILKGASGVYLSFRWAPGGYGNSLRESKLEVEISNGARYSIGGRYEYHHAFAEKSYRIASLPDGDLGWEDVSGGRVLPTVILIEQWIERQMKLLHEQKLKETRAGIR